MNVDDFCAVFGVGRQVSLNHEALLRPEIKNCLEKDKYVIVKSVVPASLIAGLANRWQKVMAGKCRFSSNLRYGEQNYTYNFFGKYKRHFQFYWNEPSCPVSRDLSLLLHYYRNLLTNHHPMHGLVFQPDRTGVYLAVTHYPTGTGEMAVHVDPNYFLPVHYAVPLTFYGQDYAEGGLHLHLADKIVNVDAQMGPGDILLFHGSLPHSVQTIKGGGSRSNLGRLQMFAIPTQFSDTINRGFTKELAWQIYGRLKYARYGKGKGFSDNYQNFR